MPDGSDYHELGPQKEAPMPIKMAAETIARDETKPNQDSYFGIPKRGIAGVFDGIGGNAGGAQASRIGMETVKQTLLFRNPTSIAEAKKNIAEILMHAHQNIRLNAQRPGFEGMGTTGTVAQIIDNKDRTYTAVIGNVGDSRAYVFRDGKLDCTTIDDSSFTQGKLHEEAKEIQSRLSNLLTRNSQEAAEYFSKRNIISAALGSEDGVVPKIYTITLRTGDRVILTTDGVHDNLTDREIESIMRFNAEPENAAKRLTGNAHTISQMGKDNYARSKRDDITAIVVKIGADSSRDEKTIPIGSTVNVMRSDGKIDSDWTVGIYNQNCSVTVFSPNGKRKTVSIASLNENNPPPKKLP